MNKKLIIEKVKEHIKDKFKDEVSGHDFWHIIRVYNNALDIAQKEENVDIFVVELAALLHDVADHKFGYSDEDRKNIINELLENLAVTQEIIDKVVYIANNISYKKGTNTHVMTIIEGKIVQDADRLDAMGSIGVARTFAYGTFVKRPFYLPEKEQDESDTISHFYEKLLLLKDKMNTESGRLKAIKRHEAMEFFLENFYAEWNGES